MDLTQMAMNLRTQLLEQNGIAEGQAGQTGVTDSTFSDMIMAMLANTQTAGNIKGGELLGLLNNSQSENAMKNTVLMNNGEQNVEISGDMPDMEAFTADFGNVIDLLAKSLVDSKIADQLKNPENQQFIMPEEPKAEETVNPQFTISEEQLGEEKTVEPQFTMPTEQPKTEEAVKPQITMPNEQPKAEEAVKPQFTMPEEQPKAEEAVKPQFTMPTEQPKAEEVVKPQFEMPTEQPKAEEAVKLQFTMPTEQPKAEETIKPQLTMPAEQPEAEETVKPQFIMLTEQPKAEEAVKPQVTMPEEQPKAEETVKPQLAMPNEQPKAEQSVKPQFTMPEEQPKAEEAVKPQFTMPEEQPKAEEAVKPQITMPEEQPKAEEAVKPQFTMPEEQPKAEETVKPQFTMPEEQPKAEEVEETVKPQFTMPEEKPKAEEVEKTVKPQFTMPEEQPKAEEAVKPQFTIPNEQPKAEETVKPQFTMPEEQPKAEESVKPQPTMPKEQPKANEAAKPQITIPREKPKAELTPKKQYVRTPVQNEEDYYPVNPKPDSVVYADMLQYTDMFGMPAKPVANNSGRFGKELKTVDFSDSVIKADPIQLSGLLGFISTGNNIPQNNEMLKNLYREVPVNTDMPTDAVSDNTHNTTAYDFVNKYIESGEVEIVGYDAETVKQAASELKKNVPETNSARAETPEKPVKADNQSKAVNLERKALNYFRTMQSTRDTIRNTMSFVKKSEPVQPENIESLQKNTSQLDIRLDKIRSEIELNQSYEAPEKQLLKGVEENLQKGRSEFTVKLKPEGLGEIIVKLVKNDGGKMLLSMAASSVKTAELLNKNIAVLQSSLSQQNVEIINPKDMTQTVMPLQHGNEQYFGQQYGESGQNQQLYEQNQQRNQNHGHQVYSQTDDAETFDEKASAAVDQGGLDIMI